MRLGPLLATAGLLLLQTASAAMYWQNVQQDVHIQPDGVVRVLDQRTLIATGDDDFGEAFICVGLGTGQRLELLPGAGAIDMPGSTRAYTQACEDGSAGTEVVVHYDSRRRQGTVLFAYELHGTVDLYSDVAQWYWGIYGTRNVDANGYSLTVHAPGPMEFPYDAIVYRFNNPELPRVELSADRSTLQVAPTSISSRRP